MITKAILATLLVTASFASNAQFGPASSRTVVPSASESIFDASYADPDYLQAGLSLEGFTCDGNTKILETPAEISAVKFKGRHDSCSVTIIYKKSYKIEGKSFHVVTESGSGLRVIKFTMNLRK